LSLSWRGIWSGIVVSQVEQVARDGFCERERGGMLAPSMAKRAWGDDWLSSVSERCLGLM
jgi:hypothetical protein